MGPERTIIERHAGLEPPDHGYPDEETDRATPVATTEDGAINRRNVDVTFTAPADGEPDFTVTLSVAATNLPQPTTIQVTGQRAP